LGIVSSQTPEERLEAITLAAAVRGRASVRRFLPDPVPRDEVRLMVDMAVRAANASNAQMWRFVAVDDALTQVAIRQAVDEALDEMLDWPELAGRKGAVEGLRANATFFVDAPLVVAVLGVPYVSRGDEMLIARGLSVEQRDRLRARPDLQSVGAAVQLFCTAAHALGYGACWMTAPVLAAPAIERVLGVEPPAKLVAIVPVGRPAGAVAPTARKPVDNVLEFR
jgi:nitroreductase